MVSVHKANLPAEGNKDLLGREIQVGDVIAYPVTVGRSAAMRLGEVVDIYPATELSYQKGEDGKYRDVKVPVPDAYNMKVQYFPESMDWGMYDTPAHDVKYHQESLDELDKGFVAPHWLEDYEDQVVGEGWLARPRRVKVTIPKEKAIAEARKYHTTKLKIAKNRLEKGPAPKTLLFPGKAVIISREYEASKTGA